MNRRTVFGQAALALVAVALAGLLSGGGARAAQRRYYFDDHDSVAGLAQPSVTAFLQDHSGHVWIGTLGGLHEYDGYRYRVYHHDSDDPHTLAENFVTALAEDARHRVWVGSYRSGVASLDPQTGKLMRDDLPADAESRDSRLRIEALAFDGRHALWIGNGAGVETLDTDSGRRARVFVFPAGVPGRVTDLRIGTDGIAWAATSIGLIRIEANGDHADRIALPALATAIAPDAGRVLWVGTDRGLYRIDTDDFAAERIWPRDAAAGQPVRHIARDHRGRLWMAIDHRGMTVVDPATGESSTLTRNFTLKGSLPENEVTALLVDRSGLLWVGSATHGFATVDPDGARFRYVVDLADATAARSANGISAIHQDSSGFIWQGTRGAGLRRYDPAADRFETFDEPLADAAGGPAPASINGVSGAADDTLYIATDEGAFALDPSRRSARRIPVDPSRTQGLPSPAVDTVLPARDGSVWFGMGDTGLAHWWPDSGRWEYFIHAGSGDGLVDNTVLTLTEDAEQRIWIGTHGGLGLYDPRSRTMRSFRSIAGDPHSLSDNNVFAIHPDAHGVVWIGTRAGLDRLDLDAGAGGRFTRYRPGNGVAGDTVLAILGDRAGNLWLGTNRGITWFDVAHAAFHHFTIEDGLQGLDFGAGAACVLADGTLAFGGSDGMNLFDPSRVVLSRFAAPVEVTAIDVDGKPVAPPAGGAALTLSPRQRVVRFEFAALDYAAPERNRYSYRMRGFDDGWIDAGARRDATYTNLPHGDYRFEVRAANHDGVWSRKATALALEVEPPWWSSRWMLALYAAACLLAFGALRRTQARRRHAELAHTNHVTERESRLRLALWGSGDDFWDWDLRRNEIAVTAAGGLIDAAAPHPRVAANQWFNDNVHEDDRAVVAERLSDHLHGLRDRFESEHRIRQPDGDWAWVFVRGKIVDRDDGGKPLRLSGTIRDITESRAAERERRIAAEVIDSMTEAVCVTDLDFRFVSANRAFTRMTGYEQSAVGGESASILNCSRHPPEHYKAMREAFTRDGHWRGELWQRRRDGEEFLCWLEISAVLDAVGERTHYVGVMNDITDRKRAEQELRYLANYDPMTGLPNRALLSERLGQAIVRARNSGRHVALLFLDLDRFKHVNDSMGHAAGDRMLRAAGARLRACIAPTDTVARLGGDEFTVVLENLTTPHQAEEVARRLLEAFVVPLHLDTGEDVVISPSIGISLFPEHGEAPGELLKSADTAMYQAKDRGRNTYMFYTDEMDAFARSRATLIAALRRGLERNEFYVVYQPKLSLVEDRVTGVEALLRWNNEEFGNVPPATFIPLAEETGLIVQIGEFVLNAACAQLRRWSDEGFTQLKAAVNLSMLQLLRAELTVRLRQILETHGLAPARLELELTETMVMANAEQSVRTLSELKAIGVTLAIDDFGTGYSSLNYLKRLPIDTLKIDQAFVGDITTDPEDAAITATIITLAHSLGLDVVAEGVETAEQLEYLRGQSCDEIQGHWFARPLEADACLAFLRQYEDRQARRATA